MRKALEKGCKEKQKMYTTTQKAQVNYVYVLFRFFLVFLLLSAKDNIFYTS